jgi:serine/threonine protein kinase
LENWKIDGYDFLDIVDEGMVVFVYRAYQLSLKRYVTIQTLSPVYRDDRECRQGIEKAADIISKLEHPNIVPIIDFGNHNGIPYIVMQWMSGGFLRDYLLHKDYMKEQLPPIKIAGIVRQIGNALEYLHSQDQVHGDPSTSTSTIVVDARGNAYIADFIKSGFDETSPSGLLGMSAYVSPERWYGKQTTPFTDQYALGSIAYEIVTGRTPFHAKHPHELRDKHIYEPVPSPQKFRPNLSGKVASVLSRALAKKPSDRYPTIMTFVREFENAIMDTPAHLFISYSREDTDYVQIFKGDLKNNGFQVWMDANIEQGARCFNEINGAIQGCAAMLVIMTPASEASECVQK